MCFKAVSRWHPFARMLFGALLGGLAGLVFGIFFAFMIEFGTHILDELWGTYRNYDGKGGGTFSLFAFWPEWEAGQSFGVLIGGILGGIVMSKKQDY